MKRFDRPELPIAILLAILLAAGRIFVPSLFSTGNLVSLSRQIAEPLLIGVGMTFVMLTGGIDLSVGSIAGLAGMTGAAAGRGGGGPIAWAAAIMIGGVAGGLNGALIGPLRLAPVVVTLATWAGGRSAAYVLTSGEPIGNLPASLTRLVDQAVAGILPVTMLLAASVAIAASIALNFTALGRRLTALGRNRRAAQFSGIRPATHIAGVYVVSGLLSAVAGLLIAARAGTAVPDAGLGQEFDAITAVLLGGGRIDGGYASISGTLLGAVTLGLLHNGCNLLGIDGTWQTVAVAALLLASVLFRQRTID